jgi:TrmH family RNA methyltransferase
MTGPVAISSLQNPHIKNAVKLRRRSHRDESGLMLIEGYREILRALDNKWPIEQIFSCREMFLGDNEGSLIERASKTGCSIYECTAAVFQKIAYRERPEGLLAVAPQVRRSLGDLRLQPVPLVVVAESIEKPGNLGTSCCDCL